MNDEEFRDIIDQLENEIDEKLEVPEGPTEIIDLTAKENSAEIQEIGVDVVKIHKKMELVTDDILHSCKKDRSEIQEVIDLMFREIVVDQEAGRNPSRAYTDNLTKLLEVKVNVNMVAVKAMEATAKMISATKVNAVSLNTQVNVGPNSNQDALKKLLSEPMTDMDDF